ncbi:tyrosine-type recombinase/integrase [Streptosporangium sp. NPDC087985]|uniref:tyrosine-type recombinase/integrase n=1 Tax=Streptosporangium sp. NPDC087985 TaxID=3366196 RepID=UPI003830E99E
MPCLIDKGPTSRSVVWVVWSATARPGAAGVRLCGGCFVRRAARVPAAGRDRRPRRTSGRRAGCGPCGGAERRHLDEWIEMKRRQGARPLTLRGYRQLIKDHVKPALGRKQLDKLAPTDVRRLVEAKAESGLSAATVKQIHGLIRNALADAEREELMHRNVAKLVKPPALRREEAKVLTIEEAKRLLAVIKDDRLEAFWICALTLGLRRGELLGLRWEDIDFANGLLAAGKRWQNLGLVFPSTIGTPIEPGNLSTRWRATRKRAGLDWLRLHDLRHACASFLLASGASPRTVMKTLGHSQIGLTMNTYTHVLPDIERAAVDAVAKKLFG